MKPVYERCSVVMIGAWNQAIFTPDWVQAVLFDGKQPQIELMYAAHGVATLFLADGVKFLVLPHQAQVVLSSFADEVIKRMESVAVQLLSRLPETPLRGVGVNFGFEIDERSSKLDDLFRLQKDGEFANMGCRVTGVSITQKLSYSSPPRIVNVTVGRTDNERALIDFNHHHEVSTAKEAASRLDDSILSAKRLSLDIAQKIYGLDRVTP